ncbi:WD-repeat protein 50, variant [Capsaspora owczarzaki ATCC 30864]|uniref:U3 small nucleolar RNA-associated protein 18 homolog n=1 Tax=Capsaspora owczarzaki (strain ATCC 30864) TaxID=595528 RepID=A0A0D2WT18_CAPO3|nr:WD-repeat protein 50, variant [Capsaspora owczarzaki ATCC 30864]
MNPDIYDGTARTIGFWSWKLTTFFFFVCFFFLSGNLCFVQDEDEEPAPAKPNGKSKNRKGKKAADPAWEDKDDANISVSVVDKARLKKLRQAEDEQAISGAEYARRLKGQFEKVHQAPQWVEKATSAARRPKKNAANGESSDGGAAAASDNEEDEDEEDEEEEEVDEHDSIFQTTQGLTASSSSTGLLPVRLIEAVRVRDANSAEVSASAIQAVAFHPSGAVLMTAGLDKTLRLYQVDGTDNAKIQSIHIPNFPIHEAAMSVDGSQIFATSRRTWFYTFNISEGAIHRVPGIRGREEKSLESFVVSPDGKHLVFLGKDGYIILVSTVSKQWVADFKMNGTVRAVAFTRSGNQLLSFGGDGHVYVWDVASRQCTHRFVDEGCVHGTAIAVSPNNKYIACGSDTGIINVYDTTVALASENPKPLRTIDNLTTSISGLVFNHDAQLLAAWSAEKKNAMRLIHFPSATTFANWPSEKAPLSYVHSVAFSPHSAYFAVGNDKGKVVLYRLKHYPTY